MWDFFAYIFFATTIQLHGDQNKQKWKSRESSVLGVWMEVMEVRCGTISCNY